MIFKELKAFIEKMNEVELLQLVLLNDGEHEYEVDIVVTFRGKSVFIPGGSDDSAMDAE